MKRLARLSARQRYHQAIRKMTMKNLRAAYFENGGATVTLDTAMVEAITRAREQGVQEERDRCVRIAHSRSKAHPWEPGAVASLEIAISISAGAMV